MTITSALTSTDLIASGGADDRIEIETHSGGGGGRTITGTDASETLTGTSGDDTIIGLGGNDTIDGGDGRDVVLYRGSKDDYTITPPTASGAVTITDNVAGRDGTDTLVNVERIKFASGGNIDFDPNSHGGAAYRLYQAAFDRAPDTAGLGYWVKALDDGASLHDVAEGFARSDEFTAKYASLDTNSYVTQLYQNVLHRAADEKGEHYWEANLSAGALTRSEVLMYVSESPENQANLVGAIKAGSVYY